MKFSRFALPLAVVLASIVSAADEMPRPYPAPQRGVRLTPQPDKKPSINGAKIFGVRPGSPLLVYIPVTGEQPLDLRVANLPKGLAFYKDKGIIAGKLTAKGDYVIDVQASNKHGKALSKITVRVGDKIALTPPMGWNSWYSYSEAVSQEGILKVARLMSETGLKNHGWTYVNIDDCWQGVRGGPLNAIQGNKRFPNMKQMCDDIHALGLKAGIYSTPWMGTYAGFRGGSLPNKKGDLSAYEVPANDPSRRQETQIFGGYPGLHKQKVDKVGEVWMFGNDAKQWALWGFDYVKVDWLPNDVPTTQRIDKDLRDSGRDIVLSLSNAAPFENAEGLSQHANLWRTTGDIQDNWHSISSIGFAQERWQKYTGPGHWNDPDILQIGKLGKPNALNTSFKQTNLTSDEQYTQMTLWCILSAPLLISCDLENLDDFTEGLLTNDDVIAVDQDPAGNPAGKIYHQGNFQVWSKELGDGTIAVGFFNTGDKAVLEVSLSEMGLKGKYAVRDLWKKKDVGTVQDSFSVEINTHGCTFFKLTPAK